MSLVSCILNIGSFLIPDTNAAVTVLAGDISVGLEGLEWVHEQKIQGREFMCRVIINIIGTILTCKTKCVNGPDRICMS